jgi:SAM-dependent methyltransferase
LVDLGAGTGKLTGSLLDRADQITAVDPDAHMLRELHSHYPLVRVHVGEAEATDLPPNSCDAVTAGAAFHWFTRPDADAEIARILAPDGVVALLWNPVHPDDPVQEVIRRARAEHGLPPAEFDPDVTLDPRWFGPTTRHDVETARTHTLVQVLHQIASRSFVMALDPAAREDLLRVARQRLTSLPHQSRSVLEVRYRTTVLRAVRSPTGTHSPARPARGIHDSP